MPVSLVFAASTNAQVDVRHCAHLMSDDFVPRLMDLRQMVLDNNLREVQVDSQVSWGPDEIETEKLTMGTLHVLKDGFYFSDVFLNHENALVRTNTLYFSDLLEVLPALPDDGPLWVDTSPGESGFRFVPAEVG